MTDTYHVIRQPDQRIWDEYIMGNRAAIFSHRYGWGEILAQTYRLPIYRLATSYTTGSDTISGILPLVLFEAPDQEKRLISLPYTDAAGIVADDAKAGNLLLGAALQLADEVGATHVELRQAGFSIFNNPAQEIESCWHHTAHGFKTGLRRLLPETPAELWSGLTAKVRNQVRKARKCACRAKIGGPELVDVFYEVFSENMRDLGSPVHDPRLFRSLLADCSLGAKAVVIFIGTMPVATAIVFRHNSTLFNPWASSLRRRRPSCPNMLLYWTMLQCGIDCGCRWFDFGRSSPDASTCRFKLKWGAEMQPLAWHVYSRKPSVWDPNSESLVHEAWKALELQASRRDGPAIRRWISL